MKTIVIDDEPKAYEILERYILRLPQLEFIQCFRDPIEAVEYINNNTVDLIFLDINMPDLSGIQLLKQLNKKILFIFTTAHAQHAIESYELNAVDYLMKPIVFERFFLAVNRAVEQFQRKVPAAVAADAFPTIQRHNDLLFLKSGTVIHKVYTKDVLYFEKDGAYFILHQISGKKIMIRCNFASLLEILPSDQFARVHKSFLISIPHIDQITNDEIYINKEKIPISDTYKESFFESIKMKGGMSGSASATNEQAEESE